jgi:3-deoxy-D-manno-octulosonic-acid transferase
VGPAAHSLAALAALVGLPVGLAALVLRPAWRVGLPERCGRRPENPPGAIWVHAASVGEIRAAAALMDQLRESGENVVASAMTRTGRDLLWRIRPQVPCALAPLDHPWAVEAALRRVRPSALALVETELWPSWILGAHRRRVPVVVVSGRISDRSYPRYRRIGACVRPILRRIAAIGARSAADAERFLSLGASPERVEVTGDLKLEPPRDRAVIAEDLKSVLGEVPLIVAGSTHEGEEDELLSALAQVEQAGLRASLVLAPRHPERFGAAEALVRRAGRSVRRRSRLEARALTEGEVLLLDSMGELPGLYARAAVAFVGGSLVPVGGHNLLEPILEGRPVLFGPHTENAREAAALALRTGAGCRVSGGADLARAAIAALRDPSAWRARAEAGREALEQHRGTAERSARLIRRARDLSGRER